ncbi:hypothetical protein Y958_11525 [Nitrospirillum viridazoti CBAmc]|uniref:Uncharacterized protein n=1 Tax=Nitrospirillum viridazoti CBAmc TaxID=1441467 RepID=A0A248JS77_9PROT|nr:hypothetical protein Y958_11525 [Nitrospirillum amazonense CBAmc]
MPTVPTPLRTPEELEREADTFQMNLTRMSAQMTAEIRRGMDLLAQMRAAADRARQASSASLTPPAGLLN